MKNKVIVINAIIAALYIAIAGIIQPFGFTHIQFRVPEMFNHLIVFNKKYMYGIVGGVFLANLFFSSLGVYDLVFGVAQSIIALSITIATAKFVKSLKTRMIINTAVFTFTMFIIAIEIQIVLKIPFLFGWLTTAIGELVVMGIGIPIMLALNKRIRFHKLIEQ